MAHMFFLIRQILFLLNNIKISLNKKFMEFSIKTIVKMQCDEHQLHSELGIDSSYARVDFCNVCDRYLLKNYENFS